MNALRLTLFSIMLAALALPAPADDLRTERWRLFGWCQDDDPAQDPWVFGTVLASPLAASVDDELPAHFLDTCSGGYLLQYACVPVPSGYDVVSTTTACEFGCANGVCLEQPIPEFSMVGAGIAFAGAFGVFALLRKKL